MRRLRGALLLFLLAACAQSSSEPSLRPELGEVTPYCSSDGWCWENPLPLGNDLTAAWADSPSDVWIVGVHGTVLHWDGRAWTATELPSYEKLTAVWASGPSDVYVIGAQYEPDGHGSLQHWNGTSWSRLVLNPSLATFAPTAIWGTGRDDVWVVGAAYGDRGTITTDPLHWDGHSWSARHSPGIDWSARITGSGANDVWILPGGSTTSLYHWDGSAFTSSTPAPDAYGTFGVGALWATSPSEAWAQTSAGLQHWDGHAWTRWAPAGALPVLADGRVWAWSAIWGSAADDLWFLGVGLTASLAHWDGDAWTVENVDDERIAGLVGSSSRDVWTIGAAGRVRHWDGSSWVPTLPRNALDGAPGALIDIWGVDESDVWVVGARSSIDPGDLWHFDGTRWTRFPVGAAGLTALWGFATDDIWAVADAGTILHWDGASWSPIPSGSAATLRDVWGSAPNDVWVSAFTYGDGASFLRWDGIAWRPVLGPVPPGDQLEFRSIGGAAPDDLWLVGDHMYPGSYSETWRWDGSSFTPVPMTRFGSWRHETPRFGIWATARDDVWIAGGASIAHWDGVALTDTLPPPHGADVFSDYSVNRYDVGLWQTPSGETWATGGGGHIARRTGMAWTPVESGAAPSLTGIWGAPSGALRVIGDEGAMLVRPR